MKNYSRSERRALARQFGLTTTNEPQAKRAERISRSIEAGKQIHQQFQMQVENNIRNQETEKEAQVLKSLTESLGAEEAARIIANNRMLEEKRRAKLLKKKNTQ